MIIRIFPELSQVTVAHHRKFSFLGIEDVHILEYKAPADLAKKKAFLFLEKGLRRVRALVLKLDNFLTQHIESVQQKNQALNAPKAPELLEEGEHDEK